MRPASDAAFVHVHAAPHDATEKPWPSRYRSLAKRFEMVEGKPWSIQLDRALRGNDTRLWGKALNEEIFAFLLYESVPSDRSIRAPRATAGSPRWTGLYVPPEVRSWTPAGPPRCALCYPVCLRRAFLARTESITRGLNEYSPARQTCQYPLAEPQSCRPVKAGQSQQARPLPAVSFVSSVAASFAVAEGMGDCPCHGCLELALIRACTTRSAVRARVYVPSGVEKSAR